MPTSTIPYDPSLVLGMIVNPTHMTQLEKIATAQMPVDIARDYVNALIRQKMSLDMTVQELLTLGVSADDDSMKSLNDTRTELMQDMTSAASDLGQKVMVAEKAILQLKTDGGQTQISSQLQSPIDFSASQLKSMPLSSDSMDMDVQYFRWEENDQSSTSTADSISSFVGIKVSSFLGGTYGAQVAASTHNAATSASNNHNIVGTLVICANCTSRQAQIFSPLVLDPDAALESFNQTVSDGKLPSENIPSMRTIALTDPGDDIANSLPVLIGASYGSSFVGFVHFEQIEDSQSSESSQSVAVQARASAERSLFFAEMEGSFGLDAQSAQSLKNLLSTSNVQSHCSLITMGLIPSIKSNQVTTSIKYMKNDPQDNMAELAAMQGASDASTASLSSGAADARKGAQMQKMDSSFISSTVAAMNDVDNANNQVIDLNSLQIALDDYVQKASDGKTGVPINFYVKYVTRKDIATSWMQKYYPDELHLAPQNSPAGP